MSQNNKPYLIAIDTGGTFTDCTVVKEDGQVITAKAPTTPSDFSKGVINAIGEAAKVLGMSRENLLQQCSMLKHGTTVGTNAVITGNGAKVGFITTKGFEDTTIIGRSIQRVDGLPEEDVVKMPYITKPEPIVPRQRIRGIYERIDYSGRVVVPLNEEDAKQQIRYLVEEQGVEAIGVSFLFSSVNPLHEQKVKQLIGEMYPDEDLFLVFSHELAPIIREYSRANTVIIDCFIGKIMEKYLTNLNKRLLEEGFNGRFMVMQSNGGITGWDRVSPIRTLSSGPAGGVIGGQFMASKIGHNNVITADMGGTSLDVALIRDEEWSYEREPVISRWRLMLPMIKVDSIGAGGGTIARVDTKLKRLIVGPESAGADPGPVCYDTGGTQPTVCDADLLLGFLNPEYFLGGQMKLNKQKAEDVIREKIAKPLNMDVIEAAAGIFTVTNAQMADLIRRMVMRTGILPEDFVLYAFGGTGPLHAAYYCMELGIRRVYVFPSSSVFSAYGISGADIIETRSVSLGTAMPVEPGILNSRLKEIAASLTEQMQAQGFRREQLDFVCRFNMRYRRQVNYLTISVPLQDYGNEGEVARLVEIWKDQFNKIYGKEAAYAKAGIELVSVDVDAVGRVLKPVVQRYSGSGAAAISALKEYRDVLFPGINPSFVQTAVYEYDNLSSGTTLKGPAIIESPTSTTVVPPQKTAKIDEFRNIIIEI